MTIVLGHGTALISVATTEVFAGLQSSTGRRRKPLSISERITGDILAHHRPNLKLPIMARRAHLTL